MFAGGATGGAILLRGSLVDPPGFRVQGLGFRGLGFAVFTALSSLLSSGRN